MQHIVNQRIKKLRESVNLTQDAFAESLESTRAIISQIETGKQKPSLELIDVIANTYSVSYEWLMSDRKNMTQSSIVAEDSAPDADHRDKGVDGRKGIPLVGIEALDGSGSEFMVINDSDILERYHVPEFKDVDFLIPLKGESMAPAYLGGDIIACRTITDRTFLIWGRAYLIASRSHGIIVKRLFPGSNVDSLTCRSDNPDYPDFEIPQQNEIDGLALVVGLIRTD